MFIKLMGMMVLAELLSRIDCVKKYGSDYFTSQEISAGRLFRIEKGVFAERMHVPELALLSWKYPKAVITMLSAFYFYGLTDVIPQVCDLATDMDSAKIRDDRVHQYFLPGNFLYIGVSEDDDQGFPIRIYSKERMLIELLRYKSKLPFDLYKEVLLNYRKILHQLDIQKIQDIALQSPKQAKVMEALQMEVL